MKYNRKDGIEKGVAEVLLVDLVDKSSLLIYFRALYPASIGSRAIHITEGAIPAAAANLLHNTTKNNNDYRLSLF